jgi:hypothetical protein
MSLAIVLGALFLAAVATLAIRHALLWPTARGLERALTGAVVRALSVSPADIEIRVHCDILRPHSMTIALVKAPAEKWQVIAVLIRSINAEALRRVAARS